MYMYLHSFPQSHVVAEHSSISLHIVRVQELHSFLLVVPQVPA